MVIITYNRKEVGNMKYDDAPAEGGNGDGDKDSGSSESPPAEGGGDSGKTE